MTAPHQPNGKSLIEAVAQAAPVLMLVASIGGIALTPLYIMARNNSEAIKDIKERLEAHTLLPSHPVMNARLDGEVRRLDERISGIESGLSQDIKDTNLLSSEFHAEKARSESQTVEFETQMDALAQSLNIQFANNQRVMEDHQNAFHELGVKMSVAPTGPFYFPNISNRNVGVKK